MPPPGKSFRVCSSVPHSDCTSFLQPSHATAAPIDVVLEADSVARGSVPSRTSSVKVPKCSGGESRLPNHRRELAFSDRKCSISSEPLFLSLFLPISPSKGDQTGLLHSRVRRECPFPVYLRVSVAISTIELFLDIARYPSAHVVFLILILDRIVVSQHPVGLLAVSLPLPPSPSHSVLLRPFLFFHCPHISFHSHLQLFHRNEIAFIYFHSFVPFDLYRYQICEIL